MGKKLSKTKIIIPIIAVAIGLLIINLNIQNESLVLQESQSQAKFPRAVIIDQLSEEIPNLNFQKEAIRIFEEAGYEVDLVEGQNVTVDFYKKLPSLDYNYIVVRSHAIAKLNSTSPVTIFTGESYTTEKYITEQLLGYVKRAAPVGTTEFNAQIPQGGWTIVNETYSEYTQPLQFERFAEFEFFAISPKLVDDLMVGKFPSSLILLGGCSTLSNPSMAKSLINRGASTVVGWDDLIGSLENDRALLAILEETVSNNATINDAVDSYMETFDESTLEWHAKLKYFTKANL